MSYWERARELDQRLLRWMRDDDANINWWLWVATLAAALALVGYGTGVRVAETQQVGAADPKPLLFFPQKFRVPERPVRPV